MKNVDLWLCIGLAIALGSMIAVVANAGEMFHGVRVAPEQDCPTYSGKNWKYPRDADIRYGLRMADGRYYSPYDGGSTGARRILTLSTYARAIARQRRAAATGPRAQNGPTHPILSTLQLHHRASTGTRSPTRIPIGGYRTRISTGSRGGTCWSARSMG